MLQQSWKKILKELRTVRDALTGTEELEKEQKRLITTKEGIVNKVFVDMLDKLGYDIQLTYVKKEEP